MLFFNANFICYYFYPTKKREEPYFENFQNIFDVTIGVTTKWCYI